MTLMKSCKKQRARDEDCVLCDNRRCAQVEKFEMISAIICGLSSSAEISAQQTREVQTTEQRWTNKFLKRHSHCLQIKKLLIMHKKRRQQTNGFQTGILIAFTFFAFCARHFRS